MKSEACRRQVATQGKLLGDIMDVITCIKECHVLTLVAKCTDVDGGIFENAVY
jgi:hypothetical protein